MRGDPFDSDGELARSVLEALPRAILLLDCDGGVRWTNDRVLTACPRWASMASPPHRAELEAVLEQVLVSGETGVVEFPLDGPGHATWVSGQLQVVRREGRAIGVAVVLDDITARRGIEAQLMSSDRMVSMGMIAAGVAHEINNPLAAVVANLDLALSDLDAPNASHRLATLRDELDDARAAAERVRQIVRDLKVFSRSEDEHLGAVDLHAVLESTLRIAWNDIRHRARLVKLLGDIPPVLASDSRLGQVLLNLLTNAAQAIPEGAASQNEIRVVTFADGAGRVVLEVSDTGAGIPADVRERLFEPFFTTKPAGLGTGLGLSICCRLVRGFGGEIEVDSVVGRGSTFRVFLPVAECVDVDDVHVGSDVPERSRGRVLVIDDDALICRVVLRTLRHGYDVVSTTDARVALASLEAGERFDLILCDLMMPEMSGVEFLRALSCIDPALCKRVVILTGGALTADLQAFLERCDGMAIEKPFEPIQLLALVNERVRRLQSAEAR